MRLRIKWTVIAAWSLLAVRGEGARADDVPQYRTMRHDEDHTYLQDPSRRSDRLDAIKHIRLSNAREGWFVTLGGEIRQRFEYFRNPQWDERNGSDGFLLQRYMLSTDLHFGPRARIFAQFKSGLEDGRQGGPRPPDEDRLDLHEALLDLRLGPGKLATVRLGRHEVAFGSQRLVSVRGGPNVRQSFDGISVIARPGPWRLDAFALKPVETEPGVFDDDPDHARTFWGIYAVGPLRLFKEAGIDLYYLGLDRKRARFDQGIATELRESVGARISGRTSLWDYNFELVYQWGRFGSAPIRAWTVASDSGFTFPGMPWRPRVGLKADVTSGDKDPEDPMLQSFNPLFPKGAYFSENQLTGPVNHVDLHPSIDLHPLPRLTVTLSWLSLWRQSVSDGLYGSAGNLLRSGKGTTARYVGGQPALVVTGAVGSHITIAARYERFMAGPFLRESGSSDDVSFFATWVGLVF